MSFLAALRGARDALIAAELRATLEPKELTLPGVWIKLDGLGGPVLAGGVAGRSEALVTIYCAVPTTDVERSLEAAEQLLAAVAAIVPPMSDPRHVALALPGGGTPATALSYQHALTIDAEEDTP